MLQKMKELEKSMKDKFKPIESTVANATSDLKDKFNETFLKFTSKMDSFKQTNKEVQGITVDETNFARHLMG